MEDILAISLQTIDVRIIFKLEDTSREKWAPRHFSFFAEKEHFGSDIYDSNGSHFPSNIYFSYLCLCHEAFRIIVSCPSIFSCFHFFVSCSHFKYLKYNDAPPGSCKPQQDQFMIIPFNNIISQNTSLSLTAFFICFSE